MKVDMFKLITMNLRISCYALFSDKQRHYCAVLDIVTDYTVWAMKTKCVAKVWVSVMNQL